MIKKILQSYKKGTLNEDQAEEKILRLFYEEGEVFFLDLNRENRIGFPEVVLGEGKMSEHLISIIEKILEKKEIVFISNITSEQEKLIREKFSKFEIKKANRLIAIKRDNLPYKISGTVGIITGGTSDVPYAEDCALILAEYGIDVVKSYDVGIAGIHRPFLALKYMKKADLLIILAGMDGVLPIFIASLTDLPIIAVPTPIGYGVGGKGEGALTTVFQSCVPGILVVNIGNTIGAAAGAIRILKAINRRKMNGKARKDKKSY